MENERVENLEGQSVNLDTRTPHATLMRLGNSEETKYKQHAPLPFLVLWLAKRLFLLATIFSK